MIFYFISGCILGAMIGVGVSVGLELCTCAFYYISCGNSGITHISGSVVIFLAIVGAVIGGIIGIFKKEEDEEEKKRKQAEEIDKVLDSDYDLWCNKLNRFYDAIAREIYCNCNRESLSNFYNHIWELEKEKKESKERPYEHTFLKVWTEHVNQLRNIININIDKPGHYCLSMMLRTMICLRSAYKGDSRFDSAVNTLEDLLNKAENKVHYIKFIQYGDCILEIGNPRYGINIENRIEELFNKIKIIITNLEGDLGEYYEKINPELSNIIDYAAELMWCVASRKPFDQNMFNKAASFFDAYTARCKIDNSCTTWKYEQLIYAQAKNDNQNESPKCLLNIHVEHWLALIYAKNSVGGVNTVSKEKARITDWINEIIKIGCTEEGFLLASGLAWMGLYDLERAVLSCLLYTSGRSERKDYQHHY